MAKKNITTDDLAVMVQKGFNDISDTMATKIEMNKRFDGIDKRFDGIDKRLDRIENILIKQHDEKLAELERRIRQLEDSLAV